MITQGELHKLASLHIAEGDLLMLGAARTAIFLNLVPVSAMLVAAMAGIPPTTAQLAGGMLVLGGVMISMLPRRTLAA